MTLNNMIDELIQTLITEQVVEKRGNWYIYANFRANGLTNFKELVVENNLEGELREYL